MKSLRQKVEVSLPDVIPSQLSRHFSLKELTTTSQPFDNVPTLEEKQHLYLLVNYVLQPARDLLGVPFVINSGFRSEKVNDAVGGAGSSQHRSGFAADFVPFGVNIDEAFKKIYASSIPYDQLIIEYKPYTSWIHISFNPDGVRRQALVARWNTDAGKMIYSNYKA